MVINEIHYDPALDITGDANGDGFRSATEDEFVEIVNTSGGELDISGWQLLDGVGLRHTFPAGTVLANECGVVVFGGGTPTGGFGGAVVQTASSGALGLNNGGDLVIVNDGATNVASESYDGSINDQSITRSPDLTGALVAHTSVAATLFSPGTGVDGTPFSGCDTGPMLVTIPEIQGPGRSSPLEGQQVRTVGIVTGDFQGGGNGTDGELRGFYIQEEEGDGDDRTSDGIFVFDGSSPAVDVAPGDRVEVTGTVAEFFGETQISATGGGSVTVTGSGFVAPTTVTFPVAAAVENADGELIADLENVEGMLITIQQNLFVSELFNLDRFGEMRLAEGGRLFQFTNGSPPRQYRVRRFPR